MGREQPSGFTSVTPKGFRGKLGKRKYNKVIKSSRFTPKTQDMAYEFFVLGTGYTEIAEVNGTTRQNVYMRMKKFAERAINEGIL